MCKYSLPSHVEKEAKEVGAIRKEILFAEF
jgi:hypothetical protein